MKQQLNSFFLKWSKIWWLLPLLLALCATFKGWVIITYPYGSPLDYVANVLFVLLLIGQVGVLIALIKRKKRLSLILSILSFIVVFGLGFGVLAFLDSGYSHDPFGMQHPIPAGMKYHEVLHDGDAQPKADVNDRMSYLQIEQVAGGGVYAYDFYYPALSAGAMRQRKASLSRNQVSENGLASRCQPPIHLERSLINKLSPSMKANGVTIMPCVSKFGTRMPLQVRKRNCWKKSIRWKAGQDDDVQFEAIEPPNRTKRPTPSASKSV